METYKGIVVRSPVRCGPIYGAIPVSNKMKLVPIKMRNGISQGPDCASDSSATLLGITRRASSIKTHTTRKIGINGNMKFCKIAVHNRYTNKLPVIVHRQRNLFDSQ